MEKDFHFAVTYVIGRLAGFAHDPALTIATSAQYVDDTVSGGSLRFATGEGYHRISTAHEKTDPRILLSAAERQVWVPFHFLPSSERTPGSSEERFFDTIVCRPNSVVAREMLKLCIEKRDAPCALQRLGITAHVFVDTWAHQGFAGVSHRINRATKIRFRNYTPGVNRLAHLRRAVRAQGLGSYLSRLGYIVLCKVLNRFFPMGHGTVLHYPDWPFLVWSYRNGHDVLVERDNPKDFLAAATELHKFFQRYLAGDVSAPVKPLPKGDERLIDEMLRTIQDEDGDVRCEKWIGAVERGKFSFGKAEIRYHPKGNKSWKYLALGTEKVADHFWERFDYSSAFLTSHWKYFHDAAQAHQLEMLHEVFPKFDVCLT